MCLGAFGVYETLPEQILLKKTVDRNQNELQGKNREIWNEYKTVWSSYGGVGLDFWRSRSGFCLTAAFNCSTTDCCCSYVDRLKQVDPFLEEIVYMLQ